MLFWADSFDPPFAQRFNLLTISNLSPGPLVVSDQKLTGPTYVLVSPYPQLDHLFRIAEHIVHVDSLTYKEILVGPIPLLHYLLST